MPVWKIQELADEAEVSLGQAAKVKKLLDSRELVEKTEEGYTFREPFSLLSEWSQNYVFRKNRTRDFYSLKSIPDIEAEIAEVCERNKIPYALTGFSGAARFTLAVRYQRVMAFVDAEEDQLLKLFEFKEVSSGGNVTLLRPSDAGVYYGVTTKEGSRVVSAVQMYLENVPKVFNQVTLADLRHSVLGLLTRNTSAQSTLRTAGLKKSGTRFLQKSAS